MFVYLAEYHSPLPGRQASLVSYCFMISLKFATWIEEIYSPNYRRSTLHSLCSLTLQNIPPPLPKRQALVSYRFTISLKFATRTKKFTLQTTDVVHYIVMFVDLAEQNPRRSPIRFPRSSSSSLHPREKKRKELTDEDRKKRNRERRRRRQERWKQEKEVRLQHKLTYTQGMDQATIA